MAPHKSIWETPRSRAMQCALRRFMLHCSKEANVRAFEVRQHYGQPRVICFASRVVRRGEALTLDICPE